MDQAEAFGKLIWAARVWVKSRQKYRKAVDSKKATPADVEKAKRECIQASLALETAVTSFDKIAKKPYRKRNPVDWAQVAGVISKFAGGVEDALKQKNAPIHAKVIDTKGEPL